MILQKQDHPIVKQLIQLMETANVPQDAFCQTLGEYTSTLTPTENIHLYSRPLSEFKFEEIIDYLQCRPCKKTQQNSDLAIKAITHVLMKV